MNTVFDDMRKINQEIEENYKQIALELESLIDECEITSKVFYNAGEIIDEIDEKFAERTGILNPKDISFLFVAILLQCAKQILMPPLNFDFKPIPFEEREKHTEGDKRVSKKLKDYKNKHINDGVKISEKGYWTWEQIITGSVAYDAITGSKKLGLGLCGITHRYLTLGHDPLLGWIFGTLNIISRTITLNPKVRTKIANLPTYKVSDNQEILGTPHTSIIEMTIDSLNSIDEDNKRLEAAVFKQALHYISDKDSKIGLPPPCLTPKRAKELLEKGWNTSSLKKVIKNISYDIEIITLQATISELINKIIAIAHYAFYNENVDENSDLYEVRIKKILIWSNVISSSCNVIATFITKKFDKLDIGGFIITLYHLFKDPKFIKTVKMEFLKKEFSNRVFDSNYNCENFSLEDITMSKKDILIGADIVGKPASEFIKKSGQELKVVLEKTNKSNEMQTSFNGKVIDIQEKHDIILTDMQKEKLLGIKSTIDISTLDEYKKEFIAGILFKIPNKNENQKKYFENILNYLKILNPQKNIEIENVKNINDTSEQRAVFQIILEFYFLESNSFEFSKKN